MYFEFILLFALFKMLSKWYTPIFLGQSGKQRGGFHVDADTVASKLVLVLIPFDQG